MQNDNLKDAFEKYSAEYCDSLPSDEELKESVSFSPEFENKMKKLIKKQNKPYYQLINTVGKRAAVIILAIFIAFNTVTFSVEALREPFIDFVVETFEKFSKITFAEKAPDEQKEFVPIKPGYISEGFDIESTEKIFDTIYNISYKNSKGEVISYSQTLKSDNPIQFDAEGLEYSKVEINGYSGVYWKKHETYAIVFYTNNYVYTINGNISEDELLKIARSVTEK